TQDLAPGVAGAPAYVSASTYAVGDIVVESGLAYKAVAAVAAGQDPLNNPTLWIQIGTTTPAITGSIYFGSGGANLNVTAGTVTGDVIDLGAGVNTLTVNGDVNTIVTGAIKDEGGQLTLNVLGGTLSDTNPNTVAARSVNVGATGVLLVSADPAHGTNTKFVTTGASTFATGAQVGLTLQSLQIAPTQVYTIVETVPGQGTLTAGTFGTGLLNNAPFLYTAAASFVPAGDPNVDPSEIQLTVTRRTTAQLGFNAAEAGALDAVLNALPNDPNIQKVILAQTTEEGLKSAYDQLLPDQGQGIFEALDAAAHAISSMTGTTPDAGVRVAGSSLWLQEVNERVDRDGLDTLGSSSKLLALVGGYERMGVAGGALGVSLAYFNAQEQDSAAAVREHVVGSMVEGGLYYRRAAGPLTVSARGAIGYSWFSGDRRFVAPGAINNATSSWSGLFYDAHVGAGYEVRLGRFYTRPEVSVDYLRLNEGAHAETGGGDGFDLALADRVSTRFSGQAIMVLGTQWGRSAWLRSEIRAGYRQIFSGNVGDTVANFTGGDPFTLVADPDKGGWVTVGFSLKSGTQFSYVALEGDADLRNGEQRYDLRVAGRSMF
nr:autotransporter domain-containing protein [Caulobacteraceae bacterium]